MNRALKIIGALVLSAVLAAAVYLAVPSARDQAAPEPEVTQLEFWTVNSQYAAYMRDRADQFNRAAQGKKIDLTVKVYPRSFIVGQLSKTLFSDAGVPDMVDILFNDFNRFVSSADYTLLLYPLGSLLNGRSAPAPWAIEPFSFNLNPLAIPYASGQMMVFYNHPLMLRCGVDPASIKTWADYLAAGSVVADQGIALFPLDISGNDLIFALMLDASDAEANGPAGAVLHSPSYQSTYLTLRDLLKSGVCRVSENYDIYNNAFFRAFEAGEYISVIASAEYALDLAANAPNLKDALYVQALPLPSTGTGAVSVAQYGTAITARCRDIPLAKEFLRFAKLSAGATSILSEAEQRLSGYFVNGFAQTVPDADQNIRHFKGASALPVAAAEMVTQLLKSLDEMD